MTWSCTISNIAVKGRHYAGPLNMCQRRLVDVGRLVAVVDFFAVAVGMTNSQPMVVFFPMGRVVVYSFIDDIVHTSLAKLLSAEYFVPEMV